MTDKHTPPVSAGPNLDFLVPCGSDAHTGMFKTLDLLVIDMAVGDGDSLPLYFVVEGVAVFDDTEKMNSHHEYFYEEHTCPTNFIRIPLISVDGDHDPHGVFRFVRSVWMTPEYVMAEELGGELDYLLSAFPELTPPPTGERDDG